MTWKVNKCLDGYNYLFFNKALHAFARCWYQLLCKMFYEGHHKIFDGWKSCFRLTHYSPMLLFYTPWKHKKTFRFSDVFRGYIKATTGCNGLIFTSSLGDYGTYGKWKYPNCIKHVLFFFIRILVKQTLFT